MTGTSLEPRPRIAPPVRSLLGGLRRRVRQYVWAEGIADCLAWLGAAFWLSLAIDWFFEPPAAVRVFLLLAVAGVLAAIVFRQIVRRAFVRLTDANMATVLERRFPQLNDSLLTAVGLCSEQDGHRRYDGRSPPRALPRCASGMLLRTCQEAAERIRAVRLDEVFNPRPLRNSLAAGILLIFSVLVFGVVFPNAFATWARRSLGFSQSLWPRMTRLEIVGFPGGVLKAARGSDVDIVVRADTSMPRVPKAVEIRYHEQGGVRGRATMNRIGLADPSKDPYQEFVYTRRNVLSPMTFNVYGGDDSISAQKIEVVDNPTVSLTLDCEFPTYTGRPPRSLPAAGAVSLPQGSRITIHAAANKELVRVEVDSAADEKAPSPPAVIEGKDLSPDRRGFVYTVQSLDKDTVLSFTLFDADGIKSRDPVRLHLEAVPDQAPQIMAQLEGIGTAITPQARVGVTGRVTDDYGIGRIWFDYAVDETKPGTSPIAAPEARPAEYRLDARDAALEVRDLKLAPGQKVQLGVKAADLCTLGQGPNIGAGERWLLEVVTPDQLQLMLRSRELVLRQRFEAVIQEMTETRDLLARMDFASADSLIPPPNGRQDKDEKKAQSDSLDKSKNATKTAPPGTEPGDEPTDRGAGDSAEHRLALHALRVQRALLNCRKNAEETVGLAEAFDDIRGQLVNNRIDTAELKERLQAGIADPLRRIAAEMFSELERRLDALQSGLEDAELARAARDNAQKQCNAVLLAMQHVLDRMIELQDYNEMVEMLRDIIKMQEQLRGQTEELNRQRIRDLLKE
jgi:hypothetical protein